MTQPDSTIADAERPPASVDELPALPDVEPESWPHETIEFKGDTLEVRKPTQQALAAFSLSTSKYVSAETRNNMTGMFIQRHLSPESYERVFSRLMDPDDDVYSLETIGELMSAVVAQNP